MPPYATGNTVLLSVTITELPSITLSSTSLFDSSSDMDISTEEESEIGMVENLKLTLFF